jgi:hypothetical protein
MNELSNCNGLSVKTDDEKMDREVKEVVNENVGDWLLSWTPGCIGLTREEYDKLTKEELEELDEILDENLFYRIEKYTPEKIVDLITNKYKINLDTRPLLKELIENDGVYKKSSQQVKPVICNNNTKKTSIVALNSHNDSIKYLTDKNIFRVWSGTTINVIIEDGREIDMMTFSRLYKNIGYFENTKYKSIVDDFLNGPNCNDNPILELDCRFELPYGRNGKIFNTFNGFKVKPINHNKDISVIYNHIKDVICSGNEEWNEYVISWISDMFQNPNNKKGTSIGIKGKQGSGKSVIFDDLIIQKILGTDYGLHTENDPFEGNFNGILKGKLLVNMDEGSWDTTRKTSGKIKSCITQMTEKIHEKHKPERIYTNYKRFVFTTNEEWIVKVGDRDRRYFILECSDKRIKDFTYFNELWTCIEDLECQEQFLYDMMNYDIKINLRDIPMTEEKELQIKYSKSYIEKYIDSILETSDNLPQGYGGISIPGDDTIEFRIPCNVLLNDYNGKYHQNMIQDVFNKHLKSKGIDIQRTTVNRVKIRIVSISYKIEEEWGTKWSGPPGTTWDLIFLLISIFISYRHIEIGGLRWSLWSFLLYFFFFKEGKRKRRQ